MKTVPLLEDAWKIEHKRNPKSNTALVWAMISVFKWRLLARFASQLFFKFFTMLSPILIFRFTQFVEKDEALLEGDDFRHACLYGVAIICVRIVEILGHSVFDYDSYAVQQVV